MTLKYEKLPREPEGRWSIILQQSQAQGYQIGLYSPEYTKAEDISQLEMHSGPETFLLIDGEMSLLIRDTDNNPKSQEIVRLEPGVPLLVFGYHNGFSQTGGTAFVVEQMALHTVWASI